MRTCALLVILSLCLAFKVNASANADETAGEKAAMTVLKGLRKKLSDEMAKNLVNSIEFCHEKAIPLTGDFFKELERVTSVKRTSLKIRNPQNAPDEREAAVLNKWAQMEKNKQKLPPFELESVSEDEIRYYKPLRVEGMCLVCHGQPTGELAKAIKTKYPQDQATGFKDGDFRGLIRISLKPIKLSK